jgi:hypothetical protein
VIGGQSPFGQMLSDPQWQPPLGWPALVGAYAVASVALVALVGVTSHVIARQEHDVDIDADASPRLLTEASPRA